MRESQSRYSKVSTKWAIPIGIAPAVVTGSSSFANGHREFWDITPFVIFGIVSAAIALMVVRANERKEKERRESES